MCERCPLLGSMIKDARGKVYIVTHGSSCVNLRLRHFYSGEVKLVDRVSLDLVCQRRPTDWDGSLPLWTTSEIIA